jgi:hypothetical protein
MKMFKFLTILLLSLFTIGLNAQDIIVKVKKGTAKIGANVLTETSKSLTLKSSDLIEVYTAALVVARQDVIIIELAAGRKYTHADITKQIKAKKQSTNGGLATVAFKEPIQRTNPLPIKGSSTRNVIKDYEPDFFYPYDNMMIIDQKPQFIIGNNKTQIVSKVLIKNTDNGMIFYDKIPENRVFTLENLPEGNYSWTYTIEYSNSNGKEQVDFVNSFKVPSKEEIKKIVKSLDDTRKELNSFSPELQELLFLEYCMDNNIHCNLK